MPNQNHRNMATVSNMRLQWRFLVLMSAVTWFCFCEATEAFQCIIEEDCRISAEFTSEKTYMNDALFGTGDDLLMNCTLNTLTRNGQVEVPRGVSSRDIYFYFNNSNVSGQYVSILSEDTAQLRQPGLLRSMSGFHIFCYVKGYSMQDSIPHYVSQRSIIVADRPVAPNLTECRVYNWKKMICSWTPASQDTGLPTNQTLYWSVLNPSKPYHCPHPKDNTCTWYSTDPSKPQDTLRVGMDYYIILEAKNNLSAAENRSVHNIELVKTKYHGTGLGAPITFLLYGMGLSLLLHL